MTSGDEGADLRGVLAVVAHPDDESFGLGALLDAVVRAGVRVAVLCFTHGEASTLHGRPGDLRSIRAAELRAAAAVLGIDRVELLDYPDGGLDQVPLAELVQHVLRLVDDEEPSHLLVFDRGGVTGHLDHIRATVAALAAGRTAAVPVLAWALPAAAAERLNAEFGTAFVGRPADALDVEFVVSRAAQWAAIARHASQSRENPVLRRRLELLGDTEHLRVLHQPGNGGSTG